MKRIKTILFATIAIITHSKTLAQGGLKSWYGYSVQARITKEWRVSAGQLFMFSGDAEGLSSVQNSLNVTYRHNSKVRFGLGFRKSVAPGERNRESRNRLIGRISVSGKIDQIRILNFFRAEWHFPERSKFEYRLRYGFRIHRRNWDLPLKARPFITNEFHYYLSGKPLWYRDESGNRVVRQPPDGLHAHRLTLGIRFTPIKRTNVTLRFMRQTEFNLGDKYRRISVEDPRNGRVRRRFNNFSAFIITTSYRFNL